MDSTDPSPPVVGSRSTTGATARRAVAAAAALRCALVIGAMALLSGCSLAATSQMRPESRSAVGRRPPVAPAAWLGLDYNSSASNAQLRRFSRLGIVYDRDGGLETTAGQRASPHTILGRSLSRSYAAGMVPDVLVDPANGPEGCEHNPNVDKLCLPSAAVGIRGYVRGFMATMRSVLSAYPGRRVLFEPMNEPWNWGFPPGTAPGARAAGEYAAILADILRATHRAGLSPRRIYVPADGTLADGTSWIPDLYAAQPCLKPGPHACGPIAGWNVHPYGVPGTTTEGIGSVPSLRTQMRSGADNVIVSEIGFCSTDVDNGITCQDNQADVVGPSPRSADLLRQTLVEAAPMHRAGWLKALIVWDRAQGGWGMVSPDGALTPSGEILEAFARSRDGR